MATKGKQQQSQQSKDSGVPNEVSYEKPVTINKWDTSALKNALDDAVKKIMKEGYGYVEDHKLVDLRLFICTLACSFSLFALGYDYIFPFPASKTVLATCAISYFILMGVLTLYSMYVERGTFMVALEKPEAGLGADSKWKFQSSLPRFSDKYTLSGTYTKGGESSTKEAKFEKSVANWFDEDGNLVFEKFLEDVSHLHNDIKSKKDK